MAKKAIKTVNFTAAASPITAQQQAVFKTARPQLADRLSSPVTLMALTFDEGNREIRVFASDSKMRRCKVDRLPSIEYARTLWTRLQKAGTAGKNVVFVAAGGFSPDTWFYDVK